jgi:hypothetical protein
MPALSARGRRGTRPQKSAVRSQIFVRACPRRGSNASRIALGPTVAQACGDMKTVILCLLGSAILSGCVQDADEPCSEIQVGTPLADLPTTYRYDMTYGNRLAGSDERASACCNVCESSTELPAPSCEQQCPQGCADLSQRSRGWLLGGRYARGCTDGSGEPGRYQCIAWERDGRVVSVNGWCYN